jgi:hypothetical protein
MRSSLTDSAERKYGFMELSFAIHVTFRSLPLHHRRAAVPCLVIWPLRPHILCGRLPNLRNYIVATSDVNALQRSDLNPFLFADIGTEANGSTLSVLSVFARRGADPWTEASRLAALSKADAADSLARMIAGMPTSLWAFPDAQLIAARLIGLLPNRPAVAANIRETARQWPAREIALVSACIALVVAFAIMMARQ